MIKKISKQFADLVIAWKLNKFFRARIKLTLIYVIIISAILVIFTGTLSYEINEGHKNFHKEKIIEGDESVFDEFADGIVAKIYFIDFLILFASAFLAYILAGKTLRPIKEKSEKQKQFISDAAHELRNPLSAIRASSESILREKEILDSESREVFGEILEESNRLISLTGQLLQLEKSSKEFLEKAQVKRIIEKVIKKLRPFIKQKNIIISKKLVNFSTKMSESDIECLVFNLIHNAIKFSRKNGEIVIQLRENGLFSVKDSGIGISKKEIPKIFNRFYKAEKSRTFGTETGSGLGLSIIKKICDENLCKILCKSKIGEGSLFTIKFK